VRHLRGGVIETTGAKRYGYGANVGRKNWGGSVKFSILQIGKESIGQSLFGVMWGELREGTCPGFSTKGMRSGD